MEVWERREELGVDVVGVSFAPAGEVERYRAGLGLEVPIESDPDRARYRSLGFGRGSVFSVWLDPRVWLRYARLLASGSQRLRAPEQDTLQLGGDALVAPDGRVLWVYRSRRPDDRPSLEAIGAAVARGRPRPASPPRR